jgi:hypothetical protein
MTSSSLLSVLLRENDRSTHNALAYEWDDTNKYNHIVDLDILEPEFEDMCYTTFHDNGRPELKEYDPKIIWPLWNPYNFYLQKYKDFGLGMFTPTYLPHGMLVFSEKGIIGVKNGLRLPSSLLCTEVNDLAYQEMSERTPDSYSPFPDYTVEEWNKARLMVASNAFTLDKNRRILFYNLSRINHSCSPNLVRVHIGDRINLITTRTILPGEQLFIQYSVESGHEDTTFFECLCNKTWKQRNTV